MASTTAANASAVGTHFVLKYYTMLNNSPSDLYNFYKEESHLLHGTEGGQESEEVGLENITNRIRGLDFQDAKVTLSVVDCQETPDNGVLVTVVGHLSNKGASMRKFVQTFLLARQSSPAVGYYIHNDIFRYLDDSMQPDTKPEVEQPKPTPVAQPSRPQASTPVAAVAPVVETKQSASPSPSPVVAPSKAVQAPTQNASQPPKPESKPKQTGSPAPQPAANASSHSNGTTAPKPAETKPAPNSWASKATQAAPKPQSDAAPSPSPAHVASPSAPSSTPSNASNAAPAKTSDSENRGIYVSNIPFSAKNEDVRATFASFGEIVDVSVTKGTALVDFSTVDAARAAIAAQNLTMDGRPLRVQEKKPRTGGVRDGKDNRETRPRDSRPRESRDNRGERSGGRGERTDNKRA